MTQFVERTEQEKGFSALWSAFVAPHLKAFSDKYKRYWWLCTLVTVPTIAAFCVSVYFAIAVMGWETGSNALLIFLLISFSIAGGICWLSYRPLMQLQKVSGSLIFDNLCRHFEHLFVPVKDRAELEEVAAFLQEEDLTTAGSITIGAAFQSVGAQASYRFFNCTYSSGSGDDRSETDYLIIHLKLNKHVPTKISVLQDEGWANVFKRLFGRRRNVRLSNAAFEKRFEVYSDDDVMTRGIMTPEVQQSFVDMHHYFNQHKRWYSTSCDVTSLFEDDEMVICLTGLGDIAAQNLAGLTPQKIETTARLAISRLSQIPFIVQNLQASISHIKR